MGPQFFICEVGELTTESSEDREAPGVPGPGAGIPGKVSAVVGWAGSLYYSPTDPTREFTAPLFSSVKMEHDRTDVKEDPVSHLFLLYCYHYHWAADARYARFFFPHTKQFCETSCVSLQSSIPFNSVLTLSAWRWCQLPAVKGPV